MLESKKSATAGKRTRRGRKKSDAAAEVTETTATESASENTDAESKE